MHIPSLFQIFEVPESVTNSIGAIVYPHEGFAKPQAHKYELIMPSDRTDAHYFLFFGGQGGSMRKKFSLQYSLLFRIKGTPQCLMGVIGISHIDDVVNDLRNVYDNTKFKGAIRSLKVPVTHWVGSDFEEHSKKYDEYSSIKVGIVKPKGGVDMAPNFEGILFKYGVLNDLENKGWEYVKQQVNSRTATWSQFDL